MFPRTLDSSDRARTTSQLRGSASGCAGLGRLLMMGNAPHENLGFKYGAVSQIGTNGIECLPEAPRVRSKETHKGVAVGSTPGSHILKKLQEARHPAAHVRVAFREESFQEIG